MLSNRFLWIMIVGQLVSSYKFSDEDWSSFDGYGMKMATNDVIIVLAKNKESQFLVQKVPSDAFNLSTPCFIDYPGVTSNETNFIYSVIVPRYDLQNGSIIFIGENDEDSTRPYPFVGHLFVDDFCQPTYHVHYFNTEQHDEFYVIGVDQYGTVAYGYSSRFAFSYHLQTYNITIFQQWPISNFTPHAVDVSCDHIALVVGYLFESEYNWKPIIYMLTMNVSSLIVSDTWRYIPTNTSWQATTSNRDAGRFTTKHIMSVSIHSNTFQAIVGISSMNVVLRFDITVNLTFLASRDNGYQRGYGHSLGWSDESEGPYPVLLANTYTFPYTWSDSIIYWFTVDEFVSTDPIMPLFPTIQYPRWIELEIKLISIATSSLNVAFLDESGQIYVILAAPTGYYPDTSIAVGTNPSYSVISACPAGTYKYWVGIYICYLCDSGTMTNVEGSIECLTYDCTETNAFCPIGSITNDTYADLNLKIAEKLIYPESPETTNIDDILIMNMFTFGDSSRCLLISPLFWVMIMTFIAILIIIFMGILKFFRQYAHVRLTLKRIFRQADLIREGEVWIGGLASFALLVLLLFSYVFSSAFLNQYPIETTSPSTFACDTTIRNAQFDTSLQSLSTALSDNDQEIFNMLDNQQFILKVDFINTRQQCGQVSITQLIHANPKLINFDCSYDRSILTLSTILESHVTSLTYSFDLAQCIGGFRISLFGVEKSKKDEFGKYVYTVKQLNFSEPFLVNDHTLAYDPSIELRLTRIINKTQPLDNSHYYDYSAMWAPTSISNPAKLFLTFDEYLYYGLLKTKFTLSITEMSYYVMNNQKPITKQAELIFHNLLFTTVCMELFGLGYLAIKLFLLPIFHQFRTFIEKHSNIVHPGPSSKSVESAVNSVQEPIPAPDIFIAKDNDKKVMVHSITKKKIPVSIKRLKK